MRKIWNRIVGSIVLAKRATTCVDYELYIPNGSEARHHIIGMAHVLTHCVLNIDWMLTSAIH